MNYEDIIRRFSKLSVLVLGDVMLDEYNFYYSKDNRPSPEKQDKMVHLIKNSRITLGGAGNVAANLASLGVSTKFITLCGNDGNFFHLNQLMDKMGIESFSLPDPKRPTTVKRRFYGDDKYLFRFDLESKEKIDNSFSNKILDEFKKMVYGVDAVILSDYNKGLFTESLSREIIDMCKDIPVIVDFKPENKSYFYKADIISPNYKEAKIIQPSFNMNNLEEEVKKLRDELRSKSLVVTLGKEGVCGYNGLSFFHIPANKVNVVDEVGCGDTVRSVLTLGYLSGLSLKESAELANYAAAVVIQKIGTATI